MSTTGGKAYLMVLNDILELSQTPDYASHPRQQPNELLGFQVPDFMVKKMKSFVVHIRTDPSTLDSDLLKQGEEQIAKWEAKRKTFISGAATGGSGGGGGGGNSTDSTAVADPPKEPPLPAVPTPGSSSSGGNAGPGMDLQQPSNLNGPDLEFKVEEDHVIKSETDDHTAAEVQKVEAIINEMKREDASANNNHHGGDVATVHVDDDLGFLHGMKLADLVREFELGAATADGSQHLGILSLADGEEAFPELPDPEEEQSEPENHSTESHHEEEVVTETIAATSGVHDPEQDQDLSEPQQQQLIVEKSSGEVEHETESSGIPEVVSETKPKSEAEPEDISKNLKFS